MSEINAFAIKNWEKFQHYKNKENPPPWIKLYADTLINYEFLKLPEAERWKLVGIWLLASKSQNRIPNDPPYVARCIGVKRVNLLAFMEAGWLEPVYSEPRQAIAEVLSHQNRTATDTSAEQSADFEHALERLMSVLRDKDANTEKVIRSLSLSLGLTVGDLEFARECAMGPGVTSPAGCAVATLKKRRAA